MDSHGYCKNLPGVANSLGYDVLQHELFAYTSNPLNPTAVTVVRKDIDVALPQGVLACPRFKTPLRKTGGMLFSPEALVVYPTIGRVPCLRVENGILASRYEEVMEREGF